MKTLLFLTFILTSCSQTLDDTGVSHSFTGQWLQFERHYTDSCFYLGEDGSVTVSDADDESITDYDFSTFTWESIDENHLLIDQKQGVIQRSQFEIRIEEQLTQGLHGCWSVELDEIDDFACHCGFTENSGYEPKSEIE